MRVVVVKGVLTETDLVTLDDRPDPSLTKGGAVTSRIVFNGNGRTATEVSIPETVPAGLHVAEARHRTASLGH